MNMMKNGMKVITMMFILIIICMSVTAYATGDNGAKDQIKSSSPPEADQAIQQRATPILNAYIWFGYAISLGMVVFIGIKYMLGAADARASMKSAIVGWLIGAFIVFMATTIVGWVLNAAGADTSTGGVDKMANGIVHALDQTNGAG